MGKNRKQAGLTNVVQYDSNFNLSIGSSTSSSFNSSGSIIAASGFTGSLSGSVFGLGDTVSFSSSVSSDLINLESKSASVDISITNINSFTASNANQSLNQLTGSLATTGSNTFYGTQVFSGSVFIATDLIVQGSSSIQYISASSVSIGTNIVNLNTATPSVRYAGISVQDSGSSAGITGSMLWDSLCNRWIYSNPSTIGYSGGLLMSGPRAATLGSETTLTCNYIAKSGGGDHLYDSCIIDDGTTTCIKNNLIGTGTARVSGVLTLSSTISNGTYTYTLPSATGTLALTSALSDYLPLAGGTLTGALKTNKIGINIGSLNLDNFPTLGLIISGGIGFGTSAGGASALVDKDGSGNITFYGGSGDIKFTDITMTSNYLTIKNAGNVGIGTNLPLEQLNLMGANAYTSKIRFSYGSSATSYYTNFGYNSDGNKAYLQIADGGAAATIMTWNYNGNVGIGNITPQAILHLGPSLNTVPASTSIAVAGDTYIRFMAGSDGNANYGSYIAGTQTAGVRALSLGYRQGDGDVLTMTVTQISDGKGGVGIGTSVPISPLTIKAGSRTDTLRLSISGSSSTGETTGITFGSSTYDKAQITAYNENSGNAAGYLAFWTGGSPATTDMTERMRITSTGVISINGNSAESNAGLDKFTIGYYVDNWGWLQTWASRPLYLNKLGNAVYAGSVRLDTLSDERIKDNIQPISGSLNKVLQLNGKKFHLKDEPENKIRYGFIAQDLEGILDEFVIQTDMTFTKGDLIVENVKSIENWASSWAALLVEAIKELKAENDSLKSRVETLETK